MNLKPVPLFGIGNVGKSVNVNAQKRTNLYVEIQVDPETNGIALYPTPGLLAFIYFGATPCRGFYTKGDYQYFVNGSTLWRVDNSGAMTNIGTLLTTTGRCDVSDNGTQIMIVDGVYGYIYNVTTGVFAQITDVDFPGATTVTFLNGYFVVTKPNSGQFYISAAYDGLVWDALDFATAESDPDNLVRVMSDNGVLYLFGEKTTEPWGDSGALDFPFARIGASAIEWGLASRWSLAKFDGSLIFLRKNRLGQVQVCTLVGNTATPVSNPEMDYVFSQYSAVNDATAFTYMLGGHPMYQINFPSGDQSWLYDGLSKAWSEVQSGTGRHRAEIQQNFLNKSYVTDYGNGNVYIFDENTYTDNGQPIARELISRHQASGDVSRFSQMWLEMQAGVGLQTGQGSNPKVMMSISRDDGHTYGPGVWREIGKVGKYKVRAVWNKVGCSRDWLFKFRITDPVKTVFVAAWGKYGR
jgi:hypothetical protein